MELRPHNTPRKPRMIYTTFKLIGDVLKVTEASLLVQKANANNQFWIDREKLKQEVEEGKRYCFEITISTYLDTTNNIKTKLRAYDCYEYDEDIQEGAPTFIGIKEGTIENFFATDINSLKIVEFKTKNNEKLYLRYFSDKDPALGSYTLQLDLRSTSKVICTDGTAWDVFRKYIDKEGNEKEVKRWFPSLEITAIE